MNILDVLKSLETLTTSNLLAELGEFVVSADEFVIFLQKKQLEKGEDANGNTAGVYTRATEQIAKEYESLGNAPIKPKIAGEPYNFEWSGAFFKGMYIKVFTSGDLTIEIDSSVPYSNELQGRFKKLLGLTQNNQAEFNEFIQVKLIEIINKKIQNV